MRTHPKIVSLIMKWFHSSAFYYLSYKDFVRKLETVEERRRVQMSFVIGGEEEPEKEGKRAGPKSLVAYHPHSRYSQVHCFVFPSSFLPQLTFAALSTWLHSRSTLSINRDLLRSKQRRLLSISRSEWHQRHGPPSPRVFKKFCRPSTIPQTRTAQKYNVQSRM